MELNQLNNSYVSSASQSLSNVKNAASVTVDEVTKNTPLKIDSIEVSSKSQNTFSDNLRNNISKISNMQNLQSTISKQIDIVNEIESSINSMSNQPSEKLDTIQPQIKNLMDNFNAYSKNTSASLASVDTTISDDAQSRIYFDGIVGAKPLSNEEIYAAITEQKERLQQSNKVINEQILNTINQSKEMIVQEQQTTPSVEKTKVFNFESESSNFDAQALKNAKGSMFDVQANAESAQSIKLLAS